MADTTCASCRHFIGAGEYNLCCWVHSYLCYRDTPACEQYECDYTTVERLLEQDRLVEEYIAQKLGIEPKEE